MQRETGPQETQVFITGATDDEADWLHNLPEAKKERAVIWPEGFAEFDPDQARDEGGRFASGGGGATMRDVSLSHHAFERIGERHKFASVKRTLLVLKDKPVPQGDWYATMRKGERVDGYIVGTDGVIKTVLGGWYDKNKLRGSALAEAEHEGYISVERSVRWQLEHLTDEQAAEWCSIVGVERKTAKALADGWEDWTWEGLMGLLAVTQEEGGET